LLDGNRDMKQETMNLLRSSSTTKFLSSLRELMPPGETPPLREWISSKRSSSNIQPD